MTAPSEGLQRPLRLLTVGLLLAVAAVFVTGLLAEAPSDRFGWDFRYQYFAGAGNVAHGRPLYLSPHDATLQQALEGIRAYVYPPQVAVMLVPLTPLSSDAATVVALLASLAAIVGSLAVVGVRDVRCYAVVLIWTPTIGALTVVNLTPFLSLALALAWRLRSTSWPLATVLGLALPAKLLLWPMLLWAFVVRARTGLLALGVAMGATFSCWALIGFQGLGGYAELLQRLLELHAENSYSIFGMAKTLGLGETAGRLLTLAVGALLLAACVAFARRGDDFRSFTCAVAATLALSPIVWLHYLLLLLVPLAVARPRFSVIWLLPVLLWISPKPGYAEGYEAFVPAIAAAILLSVLLARPSGVVAKEALT